MLGLYKCEKHGESVEHDKHLVYQPYPYPVLVTVRKEVYGTDESAEEYEAKRYPLMNFDISQIEWRAELQDADEMCAEPCKFPCVEEPSRYKPIRCYHTDD